MMAGYAQIERSIQTEIMLNLRSWPVMAIPVPNGTWLPARDEQERRLVARIIQRMKADGMLLPGALDLSLHWHGGGGIIDVKRPASRDLLGKRRQAGRPTDLQLETAEKAERLGVNHAFCTSWEDVRDRLQEWGAI